MKIMNLICMLGLFVFVSCSTTGTFKIPEGSQLYVEGQKLTDTQVTTYKRNPFFWNVASGIPYRIEKDNKVIDQGKIKSQFRVVSIFWPPAAIIYWPLGFNKQGYDFTSKADGKVRPEAPYMDAAHRK